MKRLQRTGVIGGSPHLRPESRADGRRRLRAGLTLGLVGVLLTGWAILPTGSVVAPGVSAPVGSGPVAYGHFPPGSAGNSSINATPASGYVGSLTNVSGGGFAAVASINLTFGKVAISVCAPGGLTTNATGNFSCVFAVPVLPAGSYLINASDGVNASNVTFVILPPALSVVPASGAVQSSAVATGPGFAPAAPITLTFGTTGIGTCSAGSLTANATGVLNCTFQIPLVGAGTYTVTASDATNNASASFVVGPPTLGLSPGSGVVGTSLTASGTGYAALTTLTLSFAGAPVVACTAGSLGSDSHGDFSCTFTVPAAVAGNNLVAASDGTNSASAEFSVVADIAVAPASGQVGASATATGAGFDASASYSVTWNASTTLCAGTTNATGGFSCAFTVPSAPAGAHQVTGTEASNAPVATFTVVPHASLNPSAGNVGRSVTVAGTGFDASSSFSVLWNVSTTVCAATTDSLGRLSCTFTVPAAPQGAHTITVQEGSFSPTVTYTVSAALSVSPAGGVPSTTISLSGNGFLAVTQYTACLQANISACPTGASFTTDTNGDLPASANLTAPSVAAGQYYVDVSQAGNFVASAPFTVTSATLALSPTSGPAGTSIGLSGALYLASTQYAFCFEPAVAACPSGVSTTFTTDASGNVPAGVAIAVPATSGGTYYIDVSRSGILVAVAQFSVTPVLGLTPTSGGVGTLASASAGGLGADAAYSLLWNATFALCQGTTDASGEFACVFFVPAAPAGNHTVTVAQGSFAPTSLFEVTPSLSLNVTQGIVGGSVTVAALGFRASSSVAISWAGVGVCNGSSGVDGSASCAFEIPATPAGSTTVSGSDGTDFATAVFTVVPSAVVAPATGVVNLPVTIRGTGFDASVGVLASWDSSSLPCTGPATSSPNGDYNCTFTVPSTVAGAHQVGLSGGTSAATAVFSVVPSAALNASVATVGRLVSVSGTGFDGATAVLVEWNTSTSLCNGTTTTVLGTFSCTFRTPAAPNGTHAISVYEGIWFRAVDLAIEPHLALSAGAAPALANVTATGTGLASNATYSLTLSPGVVLCAGATGANGNFSCVFTVPKTAQIGDYEVTVTADGSTATFLFTVNATTPVPPPPSSSTPAAFPWWVVAAIGIGIIVLLGGLIVLNRRRPRPRRPMTPESPAGSATPTAPTPSSPTAPAASTTSPAEDIDALMLQLERVAEEVLQRSKPPPLDESATDAPDTGASESK